METLPNESRLVAPEEESALRENQELKQRKQVSQNIERKQIKVLIHKQNPYAHPPEQLMTQQSFNVSKSYGHETLDQMSEGSHFSDMRMDVQKQQKLRE